MLVIVAAATGKVNDMVVVVLVAAGVCLIWHSIPLAVAR